MKYDMPEISWHNRDPVYSLDFQIDPSHYHHSHRVATAGIDKVIRIWKLSVIAGSGKCSIEFLSNLKKHQAAVNVVRFDPKGAILASGDVEAAIFLWRRAELSNAPDIFGVADDEEPNKEEWTVFKSLRGHVKDVCDLTWSPDSLHLASVSVDKSLIVWNTATGKHESLKKHRQFPNGVCWDPKGKYVATLGTDREMFLCTVKKGKPTSHKKITKVLIPDLPSSEPGNNQRQRLFLDDSLMSFVRRPGFSPDGQLLVTPAGCVEVDGRTVNASFIFSRYNLDRPSVILPTPDKPTVVARCSPVLYELYPEVENLFQLPYRVVFAVISQESVLLYHSQQQQPFAYLAKIHYCSLTDVSWSSDGRLLLVSSLDGFCSLITFDENELGIPFEDVPEAPVSPIPVKTPKRIIASTGKKKKAAEASGGKSKEGLEGSEKKNGADSRVWKQLNEEKKTLTLDKLWIADPGKTNGDNKPKATGEEKKGEDVSTSPVQFDRTEQKRCAADSTPTGYSPPKKQPRRVKFVTLDPSSKNLCVTNPEFCPSMDQQQGSEDQPCSSATENEEKKQTKRAVLITMD